MNINGDIKLPGSIVLNPAGTAEIRNVYIERVSTIQEEAIALTLGLPHFGRLIFNTTAGKLKQWTGGAFELVATDTGAVSGQVSDLQMAIGPVISSGMQFVPSIATDQLLNIGLVSPTNVFDIIKAIDATIGDLQAPTSFTALTGVKVLQPVDGQVLKYSTLENAWINEAFTLADLSEVTVSASEVNFLSGVTSGVQSQITALSDTTIAHTASITSLGDALIELSTQYTQTYADETVVTVTHSRGVRYVQVLVVDGAGVSVTPTQIAYTDGNSLIVTLSSAGTGTIIVS